MTIKKMAGVVAGCALVLAACGDDSATQTTAPATDAPAEMSEEMSEEMSADVSADVSEETTAPEVADTATPVTTDAMVSSTTASDESSGGSGDVPQAIISLSPAATEMLYAIDAGDQVLAVDDFSNYPPEAAEKTQGISGFEPNVEAIAGLDPDLVVTDGTNPDFLAQLDTLGIAHWEGPAAATFDDVYTQIEQLGSATGHDDEASELVTQMRTDVETVKAGLPDLDEPLTYYHELDDTYFSVTSGTFIGAVYSEIGLTNIADEADLDTPFPQLSAEFIIDQNPDLIFLACTLYCGITAESVGERPGWDQLTAVANGGVIEMNDDIASRWGPRIVEYLQVTGAAVSEAAAQPAG